jgi:hypothetical protein
VAVALAVIADRDGEVMRAVESVNNEVFAAALYEIAGDMKRPTPAAPRRGGIAVESSSAAWVLFAPPA